MSYLGYRRRRRESLESMRRRVLRETEAFLELGLRQSSPKLIIPTIAVGQGEFLPGLSHAFWSQVLPTS